MEPRHITLLRAARDLMLDAKRAYPYVSSIFACTATWDDAVCDGHCLLEELEEYLAALPETEPEIEPEIEGGVRVRALCGVMSENRFEIVGWNDWDQYDESEEKSRIVGERGDAQWSWIEATVPPYAPPAEPVVEGRVVEG